MHPRRFGLCCAVAALILAGCSFSRHQGARGNSNANKEAKVSGLAKPEFLKTGSSLENYRVDVQHDRAGQVWKVWFQRKIENPPPGTTIVVTADPASERAILAR